MKKIECTECENFGFGKDGKTCLKRQKYVEKTLKRKCLGCDVVSITPEKKDCRFYEKTPEILYWSYRVVRRTTDEKGRPVKEPYHSLHEVYFVEDPVTGEPVPHLWNATPEDMCGETVDDIKWTLAAMLKDVKKPVLLEENMPGNKKKKKGV